MVLDHRHSIVVLSLAASLLLSACVNRPTTNHSTMNHLADESSPYLLQHARNPVDWYPWGPEALARAKAEDKMIIVSVGYAACHWCHVMEHESFEDSTVAALMNEHFISIKVDREERPDIDNVYMTACQLSSQRGCGWPLNAFALPDGRPVWAGTYFPKGQWMDVLKNFIKEKEKSPDKLQEYAEQLTEGIRNTEKISLNSTGPSYSAEQINTWEQQFHAVIDYRRGGRKGAPKFPMPGMYEFLLRSHLYTGDQQSLDAVEVTLDRMRTAGIYDQAGGGWSRYSVDAEWKVPHFEKMLYDNAQLLSLYAHGYQVLGKPEYKQTVDHTIAFMEREMLSPAGGYYSSYDADSEGEEGKFYVWSRDELDEHVAEDIRDAFYDYYNISKQGNWEGHNILHADQPIADIAKKHGHDVTALQDRFATQLETLRTVRADRIHPGLDDKILCSWNGLMIQGLVDSYQATGNDDYLKMALRTASFVRKHLKKDDHSLYRNHKDGRSAINAFLDDYATILGAWIDLYQVTMDVDWLSEAEAMTKYVQEHFLDESTQMYYYNSGLDPELIARKTELTDNVIPGSNSMMAHHLLELGILLDNAAYREQAAQMMSNMLPQLKAAQQSHFYYHWCSLYTRLLYPPYELAVVGADAQMRLRDLQKIYHPDVLFLGSIKDENLSLLEGKYQDGQTTIYLCQNRVCKLPVTESNEALQLLKKERAQRSL